MVQQTNLETVSNDIEKENPLTSEALGASLLSKENIELKTEIPFSDAVWNTALLKSMGDMIELDFLELRDVIEVTSEKHEKGVNDDYKINVKVMVEDAGGVKVEVKMPLARYLGELYKRQIGYSEEYAVSYHREGRREVANMIGRKHEEEAKHKGNDILGDMSKR